MNQTAQGSTAASQKESSSEAKSFIKAFRGVRYQVKDVSRSIDFYTRQLGFKLAQKHLPAFGEVSVGDLNLILSGPGASGSRQMPDGNDQEPGKESQGHRPDLPAGHAALAEGPEEPHPLRPLEARQEEIHGQGDHHPPMAKPVQGDGASGEGRGQAWEGRMPDQDAGRVAEISPELLPRPAGCTWFAHAVPSWWLSHMSHQTPALIRAPLSARTGSSARRRGRASAPRAWPAERRPRVAPRRSRNASGRRAGDR